MQLWQKFKFGIFDVDGTIFDNVRLMTDAFWEITGKFSLSEKEVRKIYVETNGMNLNDQFKLIFDKYGVKYDDSLIKNLNKKFFALRDNWEKWQNAPLFSGIESLLKTLRDNGVKNFVSSGSNTDEIIFRLKKAEIFNYFDLTLGAEKIPKGIEHFKEFAKFSGISAKEFAKNAFLLSDGPNDMALSQKTGIFAVGITNTVSAEKLKSSGADIIVKSTKKLISWKF